MRRIVALITAAFILAGTLVAGPALVVPSAAPQAQAHVLVFGCSHSSYTSATHRNVFMGHYKRSDGRYLHTWKATNRITGSVHYHDPICSN